MGQLPLLTILGSRDTRLTGSQVAGGRMEAWRGRAGRERSCHARGNLQLAPPPRAARIIQAVSIERESALDRLYIIRTSQAELTAADVVRSYKQVTHVERAFRCLKTVDLMVRPIRLLVLRFSGLAIGDGVTLGRGHIYGAGDLVLRHVKSGELVTVALPAEVVAHLSAVSSRGCPYFFWNGRSAPATVAGYWRDHLKRIARPAGFHRIHSHGAARSERTADPAATAAGPRGA